MLARADKIIIRFQKSCQVKTFAVKEFKCDEKEEENLLGRLSLILVIIIKVHKAN